MGQTKRQLVSTALEGIALASYVFDMTPEEMLSAVNRLDSMMAQWIKAGIRVPYNLADEADADQDSGLPAHAVEAVTAALSIRMAKTFGKTVPPELRAEAARGLQALQTATVQMPTMNLHPSTPVGAGNRRRYGRFRPFVGSPEPTISIGLDSLLDL